MVLAVQPCPTWPAPGALCRVPIAPNIPQHPLTSWELLEKPKVLTVLRDGASAEERYSRGHEVGQPGSGLLTLCLSLP